MVRQLKRSKSQISEAPEPKRRNHEVTPVRNPYRSAEQTPDQTPMVISANRHEGTPMGFPSLPRKKADITLWSLVTQKDCIPSVDIWRDGIFRLDQPDNPVAGSAKEVLGTRARPPANVPGMSDLEGLWLWMEILHFQIDQLVTRRGTEMKKPYCDWGDVMTEVVNAGPRVARDLQSAVPNVNRYSRPDLRWLEDDLSTREALGFLATADFVPRAIANEALKSYLIFFGDIATWDQKANKIRFIWPGGGRVMLLTRELVLERRSIVISRLQALQHLMERDVLRALGMPPAILNAPSDAFLALSRAAAGDLLGDGPQRVARLPEDLTTPVHLSSSSLNDFLHFAPEAPDEPNTPPPGELSPTSRFVRDPLSTIRKFQTPDGDPPSPTSKELRSQTVTRRRGAAELTPRRDFESKSENRGARLIATPLRTPISGSPSRSSSASLRSAAIMTPTRQRLLDAARQRADKRKIEQRVMENLTAWTNHRSAADMKWELLTVLTSCFLLPTRSKPGLEKVSIDAVYSIAEKVRNKNSQLAKADVDTRSIVNELIETCCALGILHHEDTSLGRPVVRVDRAVAKQKIEGLKEIVANERVEAQKFIAERRASLAHKFSN